MITAMMDQHFIIALFVTIALICVRLYLLRGKIAFPYRKTEYLFSKPESKFYFTLLELLDERYIIFGKVRIADAIQVEGRVKGKHRMAAFNRIARKHFDYVICDRNLRILAAIELDDRSHQRKDRKKRDIFVDTACRAAGLPLIHVPLKKDYASGELAALFAGSIKLR